MTQPGSDNATPQPWCAEARLRFLRRGEHTGHQGSASSPLKLQRAFRQSSGHCELPLLHTAGGLVGGDELRITAELEPGSRALLTSVAAQKVYGTVARSRRSPAGAWAQQTLSLRLAAGSDLEWLPQELVLYADGLFEQQARVLAGLPLGSIREPVLLPPLKLDKSQGQQRPTDAKQRHHEPCPVVERSPGFGIGYGVCHDNSFASSRSTLCLRLLSLFLALTLHRLCVSRQTKS